MKKTQSLKKRVYAIIKTQAVLMLIALVSGCVVRPPVKPDDPFYAPVVQSAPQVEQPQNGSLYSPNSSIALFTDLKAKGVGDIITVVLQERTTSSKSSNVELVKDNEVDISPTAAESTLLGSVPSLGAFGLRSGLNAEREFTGEAEADQSNQLTGNITVTVVDRMPNGNLIIRGEKWITLNQGDEFIRISGIIRPGDIGTDNTILSTRIADARISYSGTGDFAESNQMGWLTRFFNSPVWPF